jgi:hypothetical protein
MHLLPNQGKQVDLWAATSSGGSCWDGRSDQGTADGGHRPPLQPERKGSDGLPGQRWPYLPVSILGVTVCRL